MRKKIKIASVLLAALLLCALLPTFASATMPGLPGHGASTTADPIFEDDCGHNGLIADGEGLIDDMFDPRPFIIMEDEENENGSDYYSNLLDDLKSAFDFDDDSFDPENDDFDDEDDED